MDASVLNELREAGFHEMRRTYDDPRTVEVARRYRLCHFVNKRDRDRYPIYGGIGNLTQLLEAIRIRTQCLERSPSVSTFRGRSGSGRQELLGESNDRIQFPEREDSDYTHVKNTLIRFTASNFGICQHVNRVGCITLET